MNQVGKGQVTNLIKEFLQTDKVCTLRTNEVDLNYIYEVGSQLENAKYEGKEVLFVQNCNSIIHEIALA